MGFLGSAPGARIATEHELAEAYDCSRMTVSNVLAKLARAGLVERRRKAGTFVTRPQSQAAVLEIHDIKAEVLALGQAYRFELVSRATRRSTASDRERLGTRSAGRVLELVEARLEAGEARLADAARRPMLVDEARLDEDVAAARCGERVAEARRDGAELAAAALDVARVADERLAAALAAADVGAVHADDADHGEPRRVLHAPRERVGPPGAQGRALRPRVRRDGARRRARGPRRGRAALRGELGRAHDELQHRGRAAAAGERPRRVRGGGRGGAAAGPAAVRRAAGEAAEGGDEAEAAAAPRSRSIWYQDERSTVYSPTRTPLHSGQQGKSDAGGDGNEIIAVDASGIEMAETNSPSGRRSSVAPEGLLSPEQVKRGLKALEQKIAEANAAPMLFDVVQTIGMRCHRNIIAEQEAAAAEILDDPEWGPKIKAIQHAEVEDGMRQQLALTKASTLNSACTIEGFETRVDEHVIPSMLCSTAHCVLGRFQDALLRVIAGAGDAAAAELGAPAVAPAPAAALAPTAAVASGSVAATDATSYATSAAAAAHKAAKLENCIARAVAMARHIHSTFCTGHAYAAGTR